MAAGSAWEFGNFILGCGTFGGIGGNPKLIGHGLDEQQAFATMDEAVALSMTLFDTAESYGGGFSETVIGRWLSARDENVTSPIRIMTKVAPPKKDDKSNRFDFAFLNQKFSGSLERLGVDSVEFLMIHAPHEETPIEETLAALEEIRASGRARRLGACNLSTDQLKAAIAAAERLGIAGFEVIQNGYSLLEPDSDADVRALCAEFKLGYTPFSPLAGGALTGKYRRNVAPPSDTRLALRPDGVDELMTPEIHDAIDRLRERAVDGKGVECGALALAWLLNRSDITAVVTGPSRSQPHLALAEQAIRVTISNDELSEIESWFLRAQ